MIVQLDEVSIDPTPTPLRYRYQLFTCAYVLGKVPQGPWSLSCKGLLGGPTGPMVPQGPTSGAFYFPDPTLPTLGHLKWHLGPPFQRFCPFPFQAIP